MTACFTRNYISNKLHAGKKKKHASYFHACFLIFGKANYVKRKYLVVKTGCPFVVLCLIYIYGKYSLTFSIDII